MNTNLIPDLPFKFKSLEGYIWTATEKSVGGDGWVMYRSVRDKDGFTLNIPVIKMMMNLNSGHWQIVKTAKEELDDILKNEGQRALDYLKEKYMNKGFTKADLKDGMICTTRGGSVYTVQGDRMTRDGGMYMLLEDISDDLTVDDLPALDIVSVQITLTVFERVDEKQLAIQKELQFAKAKAERLAAHISVLESKLK